MLIDVFHSDPFTTIQMTEAVERAPYQPIGLGTLNIFGRVPITTKAAAIEERNGILTLIKTTPRGAPGTQRTTEKRKTRYFEPPRLRQEDTLYAEEIQNIRAFGSNTDVMMAQAEIGRRLNGPTGLRSNLEYTREFHRLGAVQGLLLDADGTTVIYNWFDEFQVVQATEVAFNLPAKTLGSLRPICNGIVRGMARAAQGAFTPTTMVQAICGDDFWDELVTHPDVEKTYLNWAAAEDLRGDTAFKSMRFSGIDWLNYRGSDDNSTIAVAHDKVKFFPVGAPGVFSEINAPAESFDWVNTPGKPEYVQMIFDKDRNEWVKAEVSAYPLFICTRPEVLQSGRAGT